MASTPVAFHLVDQRDGTRHASRRIRRICFRCDTRPPEEIFHAGFVNRDLEDRLEFARKRAIKGVSKDTGETVEPVKNPIDGVAPEHWKTFLLHPFAPGTLAAKKYEPSFESFSSLQTATYRSVPQPGKNYTLFDIAPRTGVAVTYFPEFAPLFPIGRAPGDFDKHAWVYALWVEEAVKTYHLQRRIGDRPGLAQVKEIVVQYVPFDHVLGAVPCKRWRALNGEVVPLEFELRGDLLWNPHVDRTLYDRVYWAFQPMLGHRVTVLCDGLGWRVEPYMPGLRSNIQLNRRLDAVIASFAGPPPEEPPPPPPSGGGLWL